MGVYRRRDVRRSDHEADRHSAGTAPGDLPSVIDPNAPRLHCGERVNSTRGVYWMGSPKAYTIVLHPACAVDLTMRLLRDVHAIQCIEGTHTAMVAS